MPLESTCSPDRRPPGLLRRYQRFIAQRLVDHPNQIVALPMAGGKTAAVLTAVHELIKTRQVSRVLVIAPLFVANTVWPDEIRAWQHLEDLTFSVLTGTAAQREAAVSDNAQIHIVNKENLIWLFHRFGAKAWPYDMVIVDDASFMKSGRKRIKPKSKQKLLNEEQLAKALSEKRNTVTRFGALCKARPRIKRVVELTGTPAPNGLGDLWSQVFLLDGGERLGKNRWLFEKRWFDRDHWSKELKAKACAHDEIMRAIGDVMVSVDLAAEGVELPPVVESRVYVDLPPAVLKAYRKFKRTLVDEATGVEAVSKGVLTNKLLQFANGSLYVSDNEVKPIHEAKLDALARILEEAAGTPVLCAVTFDFDFAAIRRRFNQAVIFQEERDQTATIRAWNAGQIPLLVSHPATIGHGLNLQHGGNIAVWYGLPWSLELYRQFNKRLPRPGQKADRVFLHHIMARHTKDEEVLASLTAKGATEDSVLRAVTVDLDAIEGRAA